MVRSTGPTAPIAGLSPGIQAQGIWAGRRQLFVRFAGEAETAVLYSSEMLGKQLERATVQSQVHSISLSGRDPLSCAPFISALFNAWSAPLPVVLESDGQRPDALADVARVLSMVQVLWEFTDAPSGTERVVASLAATAASGKEHALTLAPRDGTSDGQILRLVEQAHAAAAGTKIVIHPAPAGEKAPLDRRYAMLLEQAMTIHRDVALTMRIPAPVGVR
jgi:organic radical activating enzyme